MTPRRRLRHQSLPRSVGEIHPLDLWCSSYSASAVTGDAGGISPNLPEAGLSFRLCGLKHRGSLKTSRRPSPLPTTLRTGFAYEGGVPSVHDFTAAIDGEWLTR